MSRRLTTDLETPSRRAAPDTPPAWAISTNVRSSYIHVGVPRCATQRGTNEYYRLFTWADKILSGSAQSAHVFRNSISRTTAAK